MQLLLLWAALTAGWQGLRVERGRSSLDGAPPTHRALHRAGWQTHMAKHLHRRTCRSSSCSLAVKPHGSVEEKMVAASGEALDHDAPAAMHHGGTGGSRRQQRDSKDRASAPSTPSKHSSLQKGGRKGRGAASEAHSSHHGPSTGPGGKQEARRRMATRPRTSWQLCNSTPQLQLLKMKPCWRRGQSCQRKKLICLLYTSDAADE